ncbi:MAG: hypothetical protein WEB57_09815 [Pseudohongiellaceae bacterium]
MSKQPKTVLIVEPSASGHHMALYVRHVARGLLDQGCDVILLTTEKAIGEPAYQMVQTECSERLKTFLMPEIGKSETSSALGLISAQLKSWRAVKRGFTAVRTKHPIDIVYVPTLDWVAKATEIFGSPFGDMPFVALYMAPKHHRFETSLGPKSRQDWLYDKLFRRLLAIKTLRNLLVIDEVFYEFAINRYPFASRKLRFAPDFGEITGDKSREVCREELEIPDDAVVILVYGSLTKRKGIVELLNAAANPGAPDNLVILLAGKPANDIIEYLENPKFRTPVESGRILKCFHFHAADEEYRAFRASDAVWIAYADGFYSSSGVLYQALSAERPVLARKEGLIGRLVGIYRLGWRVNTKNESELTQLLHRIADVNISTPYEFNCDSDFLHQHTSQAHVAAVKGALSSDQ